MDDYTISQQDFQGLPFHPEEKPSCSVGQINHSCLWGVLSEKSQFESLRDMRLDLLVQHLFSLTDPILVLDTTTAQSGI